MVKNLPANAGDVSDASSIPGMGRFPGGGNGNPLQDSCLENSMDRGAWWATVYGVTESHLFICCPLVVELLVFLFCLKKAVAYSTEPGVN